MIIYIIFLPKILIFLINLLNYYIISNTNSITNYQYFLYQKCITKNLVVFPIYISLPYYYTIVDLNNNNNMPLKTFCTYQNLTIYTYTYVNNIRNRVV